MIRSHTEQWTTWQQCLWVLHEIEQVAMEKKPHNQFALKPNMQKVTMDSGGMIYATVKNDKKKF